MCLKCRFAHPEETANERTVNVKYNESNLNDLGRNTALCIERKSKHISELVHKLEFSKPNLTINDTNKKK